jgi:hypothetical protein
MTSQQQSVNAAPATCLLFFIIKVLISFSPQKKKAKKPALGCIVVIYGPLLSGAHPFALAYQFGHLMIDAKGGGGGRTIKKKGKKIYVKKKWGKKES